MAASPPCEPTFTVEPQGSFKCCNGAVKNMKLVIKITDDQNCIDSTSSICITNVKPSTPNATIGQVVFDGAKCSTEGGTVTVFLLDVSNCTVNLLVEYQIGGGSVQVAALKSGNIPTGNTDAACQPAT